MNPCPKVSKGKNRMKNHTTFVYNKFTKRFKMLSLSPKPFFA